MGMMGAGKSTIGRRLAKRLHLPFVDSDSEIEQAAGLSISDIFSRYGEGEFRDGERRVIARLLRAGPCVLATGGGAFVQTDTRADILANGIAVWLDVPVETLVERTARRNTRPLLQSGDPATILREMLATREHFYALSPIHIASGVAPHAQAVDTICAALKDYLA